MKTFIFFNKSSYCRTGTLCFKATQRLFGALLLCVLIWPWCGQTQAQCNTSPPAVLAKWDFNSRTTQCNGANPKTYYYGQSSPLFEADKYTYCPDINSGCGQALLGSKGHKNSPDFANAICLFNLYASASASTYWGGAAFDPNSTTFDPEGQANFYVKYTIPAGKAGCLSNFNVQVLQKQFNGSSLNFEKQGVAVKRNGVLIYSQTQNIAASNINGTPMVFNFTDPQFCTDGSSAVTFDITFGLVHQLRIPPFSRGYAGTFGDFTTGYDNICINGTCGSGSPTPIAAISPATCGASSANTDGKITLSNFGATDKFDFNPGSTYTGGKTYATATTIPVGGVITNTLPNPASSQVYMVRVFTSGGCTTDLQVTLNPTVCPGGTCTAPTATVTPTAATCAGTSVNNNASIAVSGVGGGNRVGLSPGTFYVGPTYASAQTLTAGAYSFTALPNPNGSQIYTVRVFNASDNCFKDYPVTLTETACGCKKIGVQVLASDQSDPNSTPNNNLTTEDDYASYDVCKGTGYIDLKLTKTVSPTTGATCPANTPFVWKLVVTNAGTMTATSVHVADNMPGNLIEMSSTASAGTTYGSASGWSIPSLAPGASATLTITTKATGPGTFTNCAWINGAFPLNDPNSSPLNDYTANEDDDDCASVTVTGPKVPGISKGFSPEATKPGQPIRLTIRITNNESTPINLTQALVDNLPSSPGQMVIAPTPNLTTGLGGVVAVAGGTSITIPNGAVLLPGINQIQVDVIAPIDGVYCNELLAGSLQTTSCASLLDTGACVNVKSTYVLAPLLKKSFSPDIVQTGQNSTLTITVENRNPSSLTVLQDFKDYLPAGLVLAGTPTGTCPNTSIFGSTDEVGLAAGAVVQPGTCTIIVPVKSTTAGNYCNTISMNALIGNVSNGSIPVMVSNEDFPQACLKVIDTPCTPFAITSLMPTSATVVPGGTVSLSVTGTGFGSVTLYNWSGTGAFNPQGISTTYTAPTTTGTYTLTVTADNRLTGYGACMDTRAINVLVQNPCSLSATASASSQSVCAGQSVTLTAQVSPIGSYTYAWAGPNGITISPANAAMAVTTGLTTSGLNTFTVTVRSSPICYTTATVGVMVNPAVTPTFSPVSAICSGATLSALPTTSSNGITGTWSPGLNNTATTSYTFTPNAGQCATTTTLTITVISCVVPCSLTATATPTVCNTATNQYSVNGTISLTNTAGGIATITDGAVSTTVSVAASATSVTYSLTGLMSNDADHTVTVTLTGCGTASVTYTAPASCTVCMLAVTTAATCINKGTITPSITGGTAPFSYSWTGPTMAVTVVDKDVTHPNFGVGFTMGYAIDGVQGKELTLVRGVTYRFSVNTPGHPFVFTTSAVGTGANSGQIITAGVTNGNTTSGIVTFTPSATTPSQLYYMCNVHASMGWKVNIIDPQPNGVLTNAMNGIYSLMVTDVKNCSATASAQVDCPCNLTATAMPTACNPAIGTPTANQYSVSGIISLTNSSGGIAVITDGAVTVAIPVAASATSVAYSLTGLLSDGAIHMVMVDLAGCGTAMVNYSAPVSCTACSLSLTTASLPNGQVGLAYSQTIATAGGTAPLAYSVSGGSLPTGLSLNPATGVLSGTPSLSGPFPTTIAITDARGCQVKLTLSVFRIDPASGSASLGDYVWYDTNGNGQQDAGEIGVPGIKVNLYDPASSTITPIASLTTDSQGKYLFTGLAPGVYCVIFDKTSLPSAYSLTSANLGADATDSDANPVTGKTTTYTLAAGEQNLTVDAGIVVLGSIGDLVWSDLNKNGQQDAGEPGVAGVTVRLLQETVPGSYTLVSTTVTSGSGGYVFPNLPGGTYVVEFVTSTLPVNYVLTTARASGVTSGLDSDADPLSGRSGLINLVPSNPSLRDILTIDAGIVTTDCVSPPKCIPLVIKRTR